METVRIHFSVDDFVQIDKTDISELIESYKDDAEGYGLPFEQVRLTPGAATKSFITKLILNGRGGEEELEEVKNDINVAASFKFDLAVEHKDIDDILIHLIKGPHTIGELAATLGIGLYQFHSNPTSLYIGK